MIAELLRTTRTGCTVGDMNPWHLLWIIPTSLAFLFIASAVIAGIWEALRKKEPCPRCGHTPGTDTGHWKKPS